MLHHQSCRHKQFRQAMKGFSTRTLAISRYWCFLVGSTIIKVSNNRVEFTFFVNYDLSKSSYVTKSKDGIIIIHINSIQFYHLLKQTIDKYKYKLETDVICNVIL